MKKVQKAKSSIKSAADVTCAENNNLKVKVSRLLASNGKHDSPRIRNMKFDKPAAMV